MGVGVAVMAVVGAHAGCVAVDSLLTVDCVSHEVATQTLPIPNDDPALDFKIQRCQLDSDACVDLCTLVLQNSQAGFGFTSTSCHAHFSASSVTVSVGYDKPTGASGCQNGGITNPVNGGSGGGMGIDFDGGTTPPTPNPPVDANDDAVPIPL